MEPAPQLAGRHALVTGGASGIGLETARRLLAAGAQVTLVDLDADGLAARADELGAAARVADVSDEAQLAGAVEEAVAEQGRLDLAVNAAGTGTLGRIVDLPLEEWRTVVDACMTGVFLSVKHEAAHMVDGGAIVNIGSQNGRMPAEGMAAYCASKAGVEMVTRVAALELADRGIRVNAVAPGLVDTPMTAMLMEGRLREAFEDNTPLGRPGEVGDIAAVVLFLCSPAAGWLTGETIQADGGAHMQRYPALLRLLGA